MTGVPVSSPMSSVSSSEKRSGDGALDLALRHLLAVDVSVPVPPLPMPRPSYLKSNVMLCLPGQFLARGDAVLVLRLVRERVGEDRFAVEDQQTPAAEASALSDEHALGPASGISTSAVT